MPDPIVFDQPDRFRVRSVAEVFDGSGGSLGVLVAVEDWRGAFSTAFVPGATADGLTSAARTAGGPEGFAPLMAGPASGPALLGATGPGPGVDDPTTDTATDAPASDLGSSSSALEAGDPATTDAPTSTGSSSTGAILLAAFLGLAGGAGGLALVNGSGSDSQAPTVEAVDAASLDATPDAGAPLDAPAAAAEDAGE